MVTDTGFPYYHPFQLALSVELETLLSTIPEGEDRAAMMKSMVGFDRLFTRYLVSDAGPSIKWDGISPPPEDKGVDQRRHNPVPF